MTTPAGKGPSNFKSVSDNAVKSITQRKLVRYWEHLRGSDSLPRWSQIDNAELVSFREHLCVMEIRRENGAIRYRIREHGTRLAEYYGSACAGKHLDEFMTLPALSALTAIYEQAINARRPVYTVTPVTDSRGNSVTCERLLLPFTTTGATVDVVLTSLEAISIEGRFEQFQVLEPSQREVIPGFHAVIDVPSPS